MDMCFAAVLMVVIVIVAIWAELEERSPAGRKRRAEEEWLRRANDLIERTKD